jgi:myo-inositol-1(or 4)-monophosphatase
MNQYREELELALAAARKAGAAVMKYFGHDLVVQMKAPDQPLTEADLEADRILHDALMGVHPDYGWLSEETVDDRERLQHRRVWIVDPIDGTRSFIAGHPEFTLSIGLVEDTEPIVGVVFNPARDEMFYTCRAAGAWVSRAGAEAVRCGARPLHIDRTASLLASRSEIAAGEFEPFRDQWDIQPAGSTAYKLACVAAGSGDAFISRGPKSEWDVCAGVLLVTEAGGRATDLNGLPPRFNQARPYVHGIIAASNPLHEALLARVRTLPQTARLHGARARDESGV